MIVLDELDSLIKFIALNTMALELIIQEIKVLGNLKVRNISTNSQNEEEVL